MIKLIQSQSKTLEKTIIIVWFDINDLEKFLIYVKTEAKNQNQKN
jgi:hypothetical protein